MASIGPLHLGAGEDKFGVYHPSAFACELLSPFQEDVQWSDEAGDWQVMAKKGHGYVAAVSQKALPLEEVRKRGFDALMKALDIFSVERNLTSHVSKASDNTLVLYREEQKHILCFTGMIDYVASINVEIEVRDKNGNIVPVSNSPPLSWHRSFRYYRLSQLAVDIYEAYRNLYLSFEVLVASRYPQQSNEREGNWIRRCFLQLHQEYDLSAFAPEGHREPNAYLYGMLYDNIRCKVFHSKEPGAILPYYEVEPSNILAAYQSLLRIWRHIASKTLHARSSRPVMTLQGYHKRMESVFKEPFAVAVTEDPAPAKVSDTSVSPSGFSVSRLSSCRYVGEVSPGIVRIEAKEPSPQSLPLICRIALQLDDTPYAITNIDGGLSLAGIDRFDVILNQRLIQSSHPKEQF